MATGPQRARLDRALAGAEASDVSRHATEWERCQSILQQIGMALVNASPEVKERIGGKTGPAVDAAFTRSAKAMDTKSAQLLDGAQALREAADAITAAKTEQANLQSHPLHEPAPYQKPTGQPTPEDLQAEARSRKAHADYQAAYADQEERARKQADALDRVFGRSTATMKKIHGEPDQPTGDDGGSAGGGTRGGSGSGGTTRGSVPSGGGSHTATPTSPTWHPQTPQHHPAPGPGYVPGDPGTDPGTSPGAPQGGGPWEPLPATAGTSGGTIGAPGTTSGGGLTAGTGLGLAGAAAGGAAGGLLGTGMSAGGIRGALTPVVANPGTAAGGVRGIGATARTGVPGGALGRPGGVGAVSAGANGRAAAGSTSAAGRRGTTTRGSRGAAGARGTGAVASGRGGRGKDDKKRHQRDPFDTGDDWLEDDDAAPGVLH